MTLRRRVDRLESIAPDQSRPQVTAITVLGICPETREAACAYTSALGWNNGEQINHSDRREDETEAEYKARIKGEIEAAKQA